MDGFGLAPVQLMIFDNGIVKLVDSGSGADSYKFSDGQLLCQSHVFEVTNYNREYEGSGGYPKERQWEHDFKFIDLTLEEDCKKDNKKECSINIGSGVGLKWKEGFKPRVIL